MNKAVQKTLEDRYYLSKEKNWSDISNRVSGIYSPIKDLIKDMKFIPSSPTLMNANANGEVRGTLSSCFTMGIDDSLTGIFRSLGEAAEVTKMCGGVGYHFSVLRAQTEIIKSLDRKSSGVLPFINIYNATLDGIRQGGRRKGAGMSQLNIDHGDILSFIGAKKDPTSKDFDRMNFSVRIPDWFYDKLENSPNSAMQVKDVVTGDYADLVSDDKIWTVKQVWDFIIHCAWGSAEPGIFNSDIAYKQCTVTNVNKNVFSNPCQEFVSIPYSSCNLGSINLSKYVIDGRFNWEEFSKDIVTATHFLNHVIDVNDYPIKKIEDVTKKIRPIGLGFMGLAHCLMKMGISYKSKEGVAFSASMSRYLTFKSMETSCELAKKHGKSYPAYDEKLFFKANDRFFKIVDKGEEEICYDVNVTALKANIIKYGVYNSCFTSIAPTGTISFIAETTSGVEPIYALAFTRKIEEGVNSDGSKKWRNAFIADPYFDEYLENHYHNDKDAILKEVTSEANKGSCQKSKYLTADEKAIFITATDLTPLEHIDVLGVVARNTSLSVSKTINLPENATYKDISDVYLKAHKEGIIGVTVFRDGCRDGVLVTSNKVEDDNTLPELPEIERPHELPAKVHTFAIKKNRYFVVVGLHSDKPFEVYTGLNYNDDGEIFIPRNLKTGRIIKQKSGLYSLIPDGGNTDQLYQLTAGHYHTESSAEALTRQMSLALQRGASIADVVSQLEKTKEMNSFARAVARALKTHIKDGTKTKLNCLECHQPMIRVDGCPRCPACGYSKCS